MHPSWIVWAQGKKGTKALRICQLGSGSHDSITRRIDSGNALSCDREIASVIGLGFVLVSDFFGWVDDWRLKMKQAKANILKMRLEGTHEHRARTHE